MPARDVAHVRGVGAVVGEVLVHRQEVPDAVVGEPWTETRFGQSGETVADAELQTPHVRRRDGRRRLRDRHGRRYERRHGRALDGEVEERFHLDVLWEGLYRPEGAVPRVEPVRPTVGRFERVADERDVGKQQAVQLNQHALALRVRQARQGRGAENRVGERARDCPLNQRLVGGAVVHVFLQKLDVLAELVEREDEFSEDLRSEEPALADRRFHRRRAEIDLVELLGQDFEPDLVVLVVEREQTLDGFGVFDDVGEWFFGRRPRRSLAGSRRLPCRGRRLLARRGRLLRG